MKRSSTANSIPLLLNRRDRHCRDPFSTANRAEPLVGCRLDADIGFVHLESSRQFRSHRFEVRRDLWRFRNDGRVHIDRARFASPGRAVTRFKISMLLIPRIVSSVFGK